MNKGYPLVSVIVITYNSSDFVIEALESIKAQTYTSIELIITDDCSSDRTVDICMNWIEQNRTFFANVILVTHPVNTGISGNCNRGVKRANGEWVKICAGDDFLYKDAIEKYVKFIMENPDAKVVSAQISRYNQVTQQISNTAHDTDLDNVFFAANTSAKEQYEILLSIFFQGHALFLAKEVLILIGLFDERFPMQEDFSLRIRLTKYGYKIHKMFEYTQVHRDYLYSVSNTKEAKSFFSKNYCRVIVDYKLLYISEELHGIRYLLFLYSLWLKTQVIKHGNST